MAREGFVKFLKNDTKTRLTEREKQQEEDG